MDTASASTPEKTSKRKSEPSNKMKINPRTNNVKINRNYKQKSNSETEDQESSDSSSKGGWWQKNANEMPFPGRLFTKNYAQGELLNPVKQTFNFERKGKGSSNTSESQSRVRLTHASQNPLTLVHAEKNMSSLKALKSIIKKKTIPPISQKDNLSVQSYNLRTPIVENPSAKVNKMSFFSPSSQSSFRSSVKRFPTIYFVPKEGPSPGQYNVKDQTLSQTISSSFQSKVPRFLPSASKTPGPGTYEPISYMSSWTKAAPASFITN